MLPKICSLYWPWPENSPETWCVSPEDQGPKQRFTKEFSHLKNCIVNILLVRWLFQVFVIIGNFHGYFMPLKKKNHSAHFSPLFFCFTSKLILAWKRTRRNWAFACSLGLSDRVNPSSQSGCAWALVAHSERSDNIICQASLKNFK